jgi:hypothetical protein
MIATESFSYAQKTHALDDIAGMHKALHEDGFALIPGVLSPEEISDLRDGIDRLQPFGFDQGGAQAHYKCVFNRDRLFLNYIDRPGIVDLAESLMGDECHIIGQTAWRSEPGKQGWAPHVDRVFMPIPEDMASDPRLQLPVYVCTAHYYLNDITLDLAPTYVIPGSHKSGQNIGWGQTENPEWQGRKLEPVLCKAGDVLFFRSEIWHSGSANISQEARYLLQVHYSHRWISQQFSPYLKFQFNPEILAVANQRQRRLLGEHKRTAYD